MFGIHCTESRARETVYEFHMQRSSWHGSTIRDPRCSFANRPPGLGRTVRDPEVMRIGCPQLANSWLTPKPDKSGCGTGGRMVPFSQPFFALRASGQPISGRCAGQPLSNGREGVASRQIDDFAGLEQVSVPMQSKAQISSREPGAFAFRLLSGRRARDPGSACQTVWYRAWDPP